MENKNVAENKVNTENPLILEQVLVENNSKLENLAVEVKRENNVNEILIKKDQGMEMRKKGRLVKLRGLSKMTVAQKEARTRARLIEKLTEDVADQVSHQWKQLETGKGQKDQKEGDGIILNLLSLGLS